MNGFEEIMEDIERYPQSYFAELMNYENKQEFLNEKADQQKRTVDT